jgi:PPP family 3-phenylpropionic acid transporter
LFSIDSFAIVLVWVIAGTLTLGTSPITDAASLSLGKRGELAFGRVRGLGSLGYILAVVGCGALFELQGPGVFLYVLFPCVLLRALLAHRLPHVSQVPGTPVAAQAFKQRPAPGFIVVLLAAALINASHATFYTFGLLHWQSVGISTQLGSMLFAVGVVFEIVLMWRFAAIARRFSARLCLLFAAICSAIRWAVTAQDPALPIVLIMQSLHAISFGLTFLAVVSFISRRTPDSKAAGAQAMNASLGTAVMALTTLLSGRLYELFGGATYLAMSGLCVVAIVFIALSYRLRMEPATIAT